MHALCRLKPNSNSSKEDGQFIQELIIRPNILTALDKEHSFANRVSLGIVDLVQVALNALYVLLFSGEILCHSIKRHLPCFYRSVHLYLISVFKKR
ncbi:hypothetical protein ALC60_05624 [Trachymyrmex zeteki]|uniref:Uncharacterized protein n=1 Tax=Mycetomoellerius zeteki TaxID=64791 RepID=A0A151X599_9HYME|nr:hypothetical protein ALC60_05624 [Trachymyrmex zeteki]